MGLLGFGGAGVVVVVLLTAVAAGVVGGSSPELATEKCNYTILIQTTCTKNAGTQDQVSLRFGDSHSNDIVVRHLRTKHAMTVDEDGHLSKHVLDDVPRVPFRECATDAFKVTANCVESEVCYLYLKLRGDDDWRPGKAQVTVSGKTELSSRTFYIRRFLPRRVWHGSDACEAKVTPFGIRRPRAVPGHRKNGQ